MTAPSLAWRLEGVRLPSDGELIGHAEIMLRASEAPKVTGSLCRVIEAACALWFDAATVEVRSREVARRLGAWLLSRNVLCGECGPEAVDCWADRCTLPEVRACLAAASRSLCGGGW
ncbi:hypothetical protein [Longispora albida]|uniref:hypothetical protein n=1 Tax=Longispora albida TaxID=203523 RepID=UPI00036D521E|nr:hypothetical protein [Longispora albida]